MLEKNQVKKYFWKSYKITSAFYVALIEYILGILPFNFKYGSIYLPQLEQGLLIEGTFKYCYTEYMAYPLKARKIQILQIWNGHIIEQ